MPKDEFDFDDPMELNGLAMLTAEDTTNAMCECFIEEFMRLGYNHKQVLALFQNSFYVGPNMVLEKRGEPFVRELIAEVFARWGKPVNWDCNCGCRHEAPTSAASSPLPATQERGEGQEAGKPVDPMGAPIPDITL